jgi:hypothetical protein
MRQTVAVGVIKSVNFKVEFEFKSIFSCNRILILLLFLAGLDSRQGHQGCREGRQEEVNGGSYSIHPTEVSCTGSEASTVRNSSFSFRKKIFQSA